MTGATGFVGQRLVPALEAAGWTVRATTRRPGGRWITPETPTGSRPAVRAGAPMDARADAWTPIVTGASAVIHLAAIAHQPLDIGDPVLRRQRRRALRDANVGLTGTLAHAAARAGVARFLFVSSIKAVADSGPERGAVDESRPPAPSDCYGLAKLAAERRLQRLAPLTPMDIVIVRPPLVFGPGVKANFARLVSLAGWSSRGLPLPLASIRNRRSLIFVDNLVSALLQILARAAPSTSGGQARLYHLADEPPLSTPELLERIAAAGGRRARLLPFPAAGLQALGRLAGREAEIGRLTESLVVDASRFRRDFDWTPPWTMDEGLRLTVRPR